MPQTINADRITIQGDYFFQDLLLLGCEIHYPQFATENKRYQLDKLNQLLFSEALIYQSRCAKTLFGEAIEQYKDGVARGFPMRAFEALYTYEITELVECIISLYFERYEYTGGAHGTTTRFSFTYNAQSGKMLPLSAVVTCREYRKFLLEQIAAQIDAEPSVYFEDAKALAGRTFDPDQFYLTPEGVVIYYQQYDIAPYSSGIREFLIPYGGCVKNPVSHCR